MASTGKLDSTKCEKASVCCAGFRLSYTADDSSCNKLFVLSTLDRPEGIGATYDKLMCFASSDTQESPSQDLIDQNVEYAAEGRQHTFS